MNNAGVRPVTSRPPFWLRLSVTMGNLLQITGLVIGSGLLYLAAHLEVNVVFRVLFMLLGWAMFYLCAHSLGHYVVGRLVGIRFRGYGLRGTNHPEDFGPRMRRVMSVLPMFTVMTEKASMQQARPLAKALMLAAGETTNIACMILASFYAWQSNTPGGLILFIVSLVMGVIGVVSTNTNPKGDYARARMALRGNLSDS